MAALPVHGSSLPDAFLQEGGTMREAIIKRLEAVEARCQHKPMIILAKDQETGEEAEMTVSECLRRRCVFLRVICAGDLAELDLLLQSVIDEAWRQA